MVSRQENIEGRTAGNLVVKRAGGTAAHNHAIGGFALKTWMEFFQYGAEISRDSHVNRNLGLRCACDEKHQQG